MITEERSPEKQQIAAHNYKPEQKLRYLQFPTISKRLGRANNGQGKYYVSRVRSSTKFNSIQFRKFKPLSGIFKDHGRKNP